MPTTKTRLNIILSPEIDATIKRLAERDKTSRAGKVAELLRSAVEIEEDRAWDRLARKRDARGVRFIPHKKAWA